MRARVHRAHAFERLETRAVQMAEVGADPPALARMIHGLSSDVDFLLERSCPTKSDYFLAAATDRADDAPGRLGAGVMSADSCSPSARFDWPSASPPASLWNEAMTRSRQRRWRARVPVQAQDSGRCRAPPGADLQSCRFTPAAATLIAPPPVTGTGTRTLSSRSASGPPAAAQRGAALAALAPNAA